MKSKKQVPKTNGRLIVTTYIRTLCITTGLSLIITLGVMAGLLFQNGTNETNKMVNSLSSTFVHPTPNTDAWDASSQQGPSTTFVRIKVLNKTNASKDYDYYSAGTKTFLAKQSRPLTANIRYISHTGFYFYSTKHTSKADYQVWLSLDYIIHEMEIVVLAVILVTLMSSILGVFWIRMAAAQITKPLTKLTKEVRERLENVRDRHTALSVPDTSLEVQQLAVSFNQLIAELNHQMTKERQFVGDASHELRTPLAAIRGYISLIQRRGHDHPEIVTESMQFLDSESLRLQQLVESLLKITHNEQLQLTRVPLDLNALVVETINDYRKNISQPLHLTTNGVLTVMGDVNSIKQMVLALLDNAHKYSPLDQPIEVYTHTTGDHAVLTISDRGVGITNEQKQHIFDRFYRADQSRSSEIPGTGLGLAIVSQLAELNHVQITVSDHHPNGTAFALQFEQP